MSMATLKSNGKTRTLQVLGSLGGSNLPNAEDNTFGGDETNAEYIIQGETLTGIADAIQAKKDTTAIFTPEQMAEEIEGIVTGDDLPNAEEAFFGTQASDVYERFMINADSLSPTSPGYYDSGQHGYMFSVKETIAFNGFWFYGRGFAMLVRLWDVTNSTVIVAQQVSASWYWSKNLISEPLNLSPGITYAITAVPNSSCPYYTVDKSDVEWNSKITFVDSCYTTSYAEVPHLATNISYIQNVIDPIFSEALTETVITEYKIQTETMTSIAEEVQRISGTTTKMTTAQIEEELAAVVLQEKTVTPTTEQQTIAPDDGYYGISSVIVEAMEVPSLPDAEEAVF